MRIKARLISFTWVRKCIAMFEYTYYILLTCISPTLNTKVRYRKSFHRKLDLQSPRTLNEKLLWLKLNRYMHDPLVIQCADKFRVRAYVEECGCGEILNTLYGVYDSVDDINWEALPMQFVLKWNFGAGMNIVCTDKSQMDKKTVLRTLKKWGKTKPWLTHSEMQYKYIPKKIICERLLNAEAAERQVN